MPRASFHTLGCKLNFSETATIAREFASRSFDVVPFGEPADVVVINTCTVTDKAEQKCRNAVRRGIRHGNRPFVVVTGCYAQLRPEEIAAIPGVDLVLGTREKFELFDFVDSFAHGERTQIEVSCIDEATEFDAAFSADDRTRAFLKVQDGCDYSCSFCTIPMARGKSRSASPDALVLQARTIAEQGFKEIVLSGVNVGLYGAEFGLSLLGLLRRLDAVEGIRRFRISSIEPNLLTNEIIDFVAGSNRFVPHFHLPLQSGHDEILGAMRRRYRRDVYRQRAEHIVERMPDACIGADVIVGFPGERNDHFNATASFLADLPLAYLHVFTYSERPGTAATMGSLAETRSPVPDPERSRRNRVLRQLSTRLRRDFYRRFKGERRPVLWEADKSRDTVLGFTDNYIRVRAAAEDRVVGEIEEVVLGGISADGLVEIDELTRLPMMDNGMEMEVRP